MATDEATDVSLAERWEIDEILIVLPSLMSFRHVLAVDRPRLLPVLADALGAPIALLNKTPRTDLDGTPFVGPYRDGDVQWFVSMWSLPQNQEDARHSYKQDFQEEYLIVPLDDRIEMTIRAFVEWNDPQVSLPTREIIDWVISNRDCFRWMIVLLNSERFEPLLFVSEDMTAIRTVTRTICEVATTSLLSVWAGPEVRRG